MTATTTRPGKTRSRKLDQIDEATLLASVSPKLKKIYLMAKPLRGKLTKAIEQK